MRFVVFMATIALMMGFKSDKLVIKGNIAGKESARIVLMDGKNLVAESKVKGNKFNLKINDLDVNKIYTLSWGDKNSESSLIFPDSKKISIVINDSVVVKGGLMQEQWNLYQLENKKYESTLKEMEAEYKKSGQTLFARMSFRAEKMDLDSLKEAIDDKFIKSNDNLFGAYIVYNRLATLAMKKLVLHKYELLGENARKTVYGKEVEKRINTEKNTTLGFTAPNFTLNTPEGKAVTLYDIKAKVKVIDFWASWCGPCRAENPNVRRIYEKYKDQGLEIIGVSLDNNKAKWLDAINKDNLPWIHVSDLKGWGCRVAAEYGVKSVPFALILDKDNKIVGVHLVGTALEKCIEKYINE